MQLELLLSATLTFKQHVICIIPCHTPTFPAYTMTVVFRMCQRISISTCILVPSVLLCQINCTLQFLNTVALLSLVVKFLTLIIIILVFKLPFNIKRKDNCRMLLLAVLKHISDYILGSYIATATIDLVLSLPS